MINLIVILIHESVFIEYWDNWISERWKFHHLPYPVRCQLCTTFWTSMLYIIITGNFTIPGVMLCLLNAHATKITTPLLRMIENIGLKTIFLVNKWLKLQ